MSQLTRLDITDLRIMKLLSRDSRTPYRNIASAVGIMPSAAKERINKMVSNGAIRCFVLFVNPVILGYEKECILTGIVFQSRIQKLLIVWKLGNFWIHMHIVQINVTLRDKCLFLLMMHTLLYLWMPNPINRLAN